MTLEGYKEAFLEYLNEKVVLKQPKNLYEPIIYILGIGGKRLRPVLTLMICDLFGGDSKKSFDAALAVEVFHNFTLVHDDIMDSAPIRRGKETVHKKWDENTGILSGDAMMIIAYQCFESYDVHLYKKLLKVFNKTALEVCEGQQLDVDFESRNDVSIDEYLTMITNKTSVLIAAAMQMGAIISNVDDEQAEAIYNFGLNLGIAFQLQDDYLDTFGNAETFGKQIGGDILENKKTYLYLKALQVSSESDAKNLVELYNSNITNAEKVKHVTQIFENNNIGGLTKQAIQNYTDKAFKDLEKLKISDKNKNILKEFGLGLMKRSI
ncbi:geranylgeranyl diphosphate synthase, type II [Lutibacter oricola]|uniref:Geranylgeranyl diphosphate synthase, type II n=1 Tax=Lutibacter oricola TaxID=762486 RepID=A0A1H3DW75_9FLAO|nr:polyprenyl synthetase family protein [Lutibacter oricola]SDX70378.1 geranylgeranyl diphosphate synthase, type II [Lutibacter oricola]